jgi:spermidine/putrescine transport system ATP-binding protein
LTGGRRTGWKRLPRLSKPGQHDPGQKWEYRVTGTTAVEAKAVVKTFGKGETAFRALNDVSIVIEKGEFFTLLGPSGCGKTTLLRCIAGFETPSAGAILLSGRDITAEPPNRRPVNTVFQSYALFPHLTVAQNVAFGLEMLGKPKAEVAATVERVLALVKLDAFAARKPAQLSGGQQQRVALARALAPAPEVLLLDEPLSALDLKLRKEMQSTFVFVTHDQEEALTMSDRVGVMSAGKLLQVGSPREIYNHPVNRFVADFIGETNFIPAIAQGGIVRLAGGEAVAERAGDGPVTVAIRPEQVRIAAAGTDGIPATVARCVYFGTDTHVHVMLDGGVEVVARVQSPPSGDAGFAPGAHVVVRFAPDAVQVLDD